MNKKIILATVATIAAVGTAQGVYADEVQGTTGTGNETSTVKASTVGATGTEKNGTAEDIKQPTIKNSNEEAGSKSNDPNKQGNATEFTKDGNDIQVKNPEVVLDQSNGNGKYQGFTVEYKNIHFPDDMAINEGDKVIMTFPEEINFQTKYEFDVKNPENAVVGKASTNPEDRTVTTVFNDYFKNHPLNKQMSLKMDAKWTDKVQSGKPVTANFNGTVVTAQIGKEQEIGKDELLSKWGSQDENDPSVINWTVRVNYARKVLNYVKIIDEMSENQKLIDNYFEIKNIESLDPWIDKGSAMDLVKSISKSDHGFTITMDRLDHMIYLNYKTKLINAVKDSTNPTNKVELKAETDGATSYSYVQLVGGKGDASGENKPAPVFEIPKESPKVEIPEFQGGIPGIPEVREKPEYTEPIGTVPGDAPVLDKPEWQGGTVPFDAPKYEKPEWHGGVVPFDAPVLDKPELHIPVDPEKPSEPNKPNSDKPKPQPKQDTPHEINSNPSNKPAEPQKEQVNVIYQPQETNAHTLPNTGSESTLILSFAGMFILSGIARIALKREGE